MADTVSTTTIFNGKRLKAVRITNKSDGTGESAVLKIDISDFTAPDGRTATYFVLDAIEWSIKGMRVELLWDATTDDTAMVLAAGAGKRLFKHIGGLRNPKSSGWTGDMRLTTNGQISGDSYDITLYFRPHA